MLTVLNHPLVQHDLTLLRDETTDSPGFRAAANRISRHLAVAATQQLAVVTTTVRTPLEETTGFQTSEPIVLVPVLRAGIAMLAPFSEMIPQAAIGYLGLRRNEETLEPEEYMFSFPKTSEQATVLLLDPMLATGGSMCASIRHILKEGVGKITAVSIIAAPEGIARVHKEFPNIPVVTAAVDRQLNDIGFILPGLGDAGDRFHG